MVWPSSLLEISVDRKSCLVLTPIIAGGSFPPEKLGPVFLSAVVCPQPKSWCWIFSHTPTSQLVKGTDWELFSKSHGRAGVPEGLLPVCFYQLEKSSHKILIMVSKPLTLSQHGGSAGSAASCRRLFQISVHSLLSEIFFFPQGFSNSSARQMHAVQLPGVRLETRTQ